jgi:hypothetical protein
MPSDRQIKRLEVQKQIIKHFDDNIPYFTDIFDEKTFYIFCGVVVVLSIVAVIILSYCCQVRLDDVDELRRKREKKERKLKEKLAVKLLNDKLKKSKANSDEYKDIKEKLEILKKSIKEAKENRKLEQTFFDDTDYDHSDDEEENKQDSRTSSTAPLKSE